MSADHRPQTGAGTVAILGILVTIGLLALGARHPLVGLGGLEAPLGAQAGLVFVGDVVVVLHALQVHAHILEAFAALAVAGGLEAAAAQAEVQARVVAERQREVAALEALREPFGHLGRALRHGERPAVRARPTRVWKERPWHRDARRVISAATGGSSSGSSRSPREP